MDRSNELLKKLVNTITTVHLDMGGDHRYALSHKSHKVLTEIKGYFIETEMCKCNPARTGWTSTFNGPVCNACGRLRD